MRRHFRTHPNLDNVSMSSGHHYQFVTDPHYRIVPPSPPWTRNSGSPSPSSAVYLRRFNSPETTSPTSDGADPGDRDVSIASRMASGSHCPYGHEQCPAACPAYSPVSASTRTIEPIPTYNPGRNNAYQLRHATSHSSEPTGGEGSKARASAPRLKYPMAPNKSRRLSASSSTTSPDSGKVTVQQYPVYSFPPPPPPTWNYSAPYLQSGPPRAGDT